MASLLYKRGIIIIYLSNIDDVHFNCTNSLVRISVWCKTIRARAVKLWPLINCRAMCHHAENNIPLFVFCEVIVMLTRR